MEKIKLYKGLEKKFSILRLFLFFMVIPFTISLSNYTYDKNLYVYIMTFTVLYLSLVIFSAYGTKCELFLKYTIYFDITIISLFVYLFGGTKSEAYFLYFLFILYAGTKYGYMGTIISLVQSLLYYTIASFLYGDFYFNNYIIRVIYLVSITYVMYEVNNKIKESNLNEKKARELAYTDSLTELPNRLLMSDIFEKMRKNYERTGKTFAISIIDIDNFKNINDTKGHAFGDKVLQKLSKLFLQCLSSEDFICRFGGEEFLIFFAEENINIVCDKAKMICEKVKENDFYGEKVTVSIGVSVFNDNYTMIENISFADEAMYAVKNTGKNKVLLYDDLKFKIKHA